MTSNNKYNIKIVLVIILSLLLCVSIYFRAAYLGPKSTKETKIDSLETKIDSLEAVRQKIITVIDSNKTHINIIHEEYKTTVNHIIYQSMVADKNDITDYIEEYARQHNYIDTMASKDN